MWAWFAGRLRTLCLKISMRKIAIPLFVCSALRPPFATLPFAMCMVASAAMPSIRNVYGGFRCYAVNADGARYCRTPLFRDEQEPAGIGCLENICIDGLTCYYTGQDASQPAILMESRGKNVQIHNFRMIKSNLGNPAFQAGNIPGTEIAADGTCCTLAVQPGQSGISGGKHSGHRNCGGWNVLHPCGQAAALAAGVVSESGDEHQGPLTETFIYIEWAVAMLQQPIQAVENPPRGFSTGFCSLLRA